MKTPLKEIKRIARGNLTGHYLVPMKLYVFASMITMLAELPFLMLQTPYANTIQTVTQYLAEFLIALVGSVLTIGQTLMHLSMARHQTYSTNQLFYAFKNHTDHYFIYGLVITLSSYISFIPFYIGKFLLSKDMTIRTGIICILLILISFVLQFLFQLEFQFLYLTALDNEDLFPVQVLKKSHCLIKGHRKRLFLLLLSFFGMDILAILSMGIGYLWIYPYQMQAVSNFYLDMIGELPVQETYTFNQYV